VKSGVNLSPTGTLSCEKEVGRLKEEEGKLGPFAKKETGGGATIVAEGGKSTRECQGRRIFFSRKHYKGAKENRKQVAAS